MDLSNLTPEIQQEIALHVPYDQLLSLCNTYPSFGLNVCNDGYFWHRRYLYDFGDDDALYMFSELDWRQRYIMRDYMEQMWDSLVVWRRRRPTDNGITKSEFISRYPYRVYEIGEYDEVDMYEENRYPVLSKDVFGKRISSNRDTVGVITLNNTIEIIQDGDSMFYNIDAKDIILHVHFMYVITQNDHVMMAQIGDELVDTKWPRCLQLVTHRMGVVMIDIDHNIILVLPTTTGETYNTGYTGKYIASTGTGIIYVDMNNNVWWWENHDNRDFFPTRVEEWRLIEGIRGKEVAGDHQEILLIDMDDNVWSFGPGVEPIRFNIKGKHVYMDEGRSIIIDVDHNIWGFGYNHGNKLWGSDDEHIETPIMLNGFKALDASISESYTYVIGDYYNDVIRYI